MKTLLDYLKEGKYDNLILIEDRLATKNLVLGKRVYGEKLIQKGGVEYRLWNPKRSKLAAAILNDLKVLPLKKDSKVLYLGAASGTTASHFSDLVPRGLIFCVEFSPRVFTKLMSISEHRKNMIPVFGDASEPQRYASLVEKCDLVYQDIAQPNQAEILAENIRYFLIPKGTFMIAIKARSIDAVKSPKDVFRREIKKLKSYNLKIAEVVPLEPFEKDHVLVAGESIL